MEIKESTTKEELEAAIEELRTPLSDLYMRINELLDKIDKEKQIALKEMEERIKPLLAEREKLTLEESLINEKIKKAKDEFRILESLRDAENPVGQIMFQWVKVHRFSRYYEKSGLMGRIEIWNEDSIAPQNCSSWAIPNVGQKIIRHLKKNGEPSSRFTAFTEYRITEWFKDGVDPNSKGKSLP